MAPPIVASTLAAMVEMPVPLTYVDVELTFFCNITVNTVLSGLSPTQLNALTTKSYVPATKGALLN
jgi:hypothetical protein